MGHNRIRTPPIGILVALRPSYKPALMGQGRVYLPLSGESFCHVSGRHGHDVIPSVTPRAMLPQDTVQSCHGHPTWAELLRRMLRSRPTISRASAARGMNVRRLGDRYGHRHLPLLHIPREPQHYVLLRSALAASLSAARQAPVQDPIVLAYLGSNDPGTIRQSAYMVRVWASS